MRLRPPIGLRGERGERRLVILLGLPLVVLLALALDWIGVFEPLDLEIYDRGLAWRGKLLSEPSEVALVVVDDEAIERLGWPLSDARLAEIIEAATAAGARTIGIDIYRDRPVREGQERLVRALTGDTPVIGAMLFPDPGAGVAEVRPPPALVPAQSYGFVDMVLDVDGSVRRALLYMDDGGAPVTGFALKAALAHLGPEGIRPRPAAKNPSHLQIGPSVLAPIDSDFGGYRSVDSRGYQTLIDYRRPRAAIPEIDAIALTAEGDPQGILRDKLVLIGTVSGTVKDNFVTPPAFGSSGPVTPGVTLHAVIADQLIRYARAQGRPVQALEWRWEALLVVLCAVATAAIAVTLRQTIVLAGLLFAAPAAVLAAGLLALSNNLWLPLAPSASAAFGAAALLLAATLARLRAERAALMGIFSTQVSESVAGLLWEQRGRFLEGGRPRSTRQQATVMFVDLAGSTAVIERLQPDQGMDWLSRYLSAMADIAVGAGGFIEKFTGDGLMVVFGAPIPRTEQAQVEQDAVTAADCALAMADRLEELNEGLEAAGLPRMRLRIGIDSGDVSAGLVGADARMQYTVIGDPANTAARLEGFGKDDPTYSRDSDGRALPCRILVSERCVERLGGRFPVQTLGTADLRGKAAAEPIYRLIGPAAQQQGDEPACPTASAARGA